MPNQMPALERPEAFADVPRMRYWGDRKPPANRVDIFSVTAATAAGTSSADGSSTSSGNVATMRMYGPIDSWGGLWGISARDVSEALDSLGSDIAEIRVRINSPGGEAWEGMAILNMLRAHPAKVVAVVDGIAASAASFIATGVDETVMSPGTQLMIHDASGFAFGPAAIMRKSAQALDSVSNSIASIYAESAGGTDADWRALMEEETWYTAQEAVDAHLADRLEVVPDAGETATSGAEPAVDPGDGSEFENRFDLSMYNHAGRSKAPAPKPPSASASGSRTTTQEGSPVVAFTDDQLTNMRQALGVAQDADEATIVAALGEALSERAEPASNTAVPEGHVVIPAAQLADLQAGATAGMQAAARLREQERETFLDSVRTKFAPANREAWAKEFDRDPEGTRKHFASAPDIVNLAPAGHGGGDSDNSQADEDYMALFGADQKQEA